MFGIQFYYTIPASLPQARFFIFSPLFAIHSFYELLLPHGRYALFSAVYQKHAGKLPAGCGGKLAPIHIPHAPRRLDEGKPRPVRQPCRFGRPLMRCVLRDALTAQAVKIIFDAGVLRSEIRCDEALCLFRNRRLRPGVIHRMHGFRRRFFIQQQRQKINHRGSAGDGVLFQRQLRKGGQSIRQCRRQLHPGDIGTFRTRIREKWQRYKFHCVFWSVL